MKTIKDSVHDHIEVAGPALALLDTPTVQRLRHIKQLGTVELVYPSANHTRFEHSLGVYHLACKVLGHLNIKGRTADHIRAAALLHDIGHTPYSHNIEPLVQRRTGNAHDDVGGVIRSSQISSVLDEHDLDPNRIESLIAGNGKYGQLISGELDVDRMDYLVRDAHHTGVPYGIIDHGRLIREQAFIDDQLVLTAGNVQTAESLLLARALMNPTVYNHHVARISKSMLRRATDRLLERNEITPQSLRQMDDHDLYAALRACDDTSEMADRIAYRELYKRAVWVDMTAVPDEIIDASYDEVRSLENEVATVAGIAPDHVVFDVQPRPQMRETSTRVLIGGEIQKLSDQSALVDALRAASQQQWRFGVYTTSELTELVGHTTEAVLGLDTGGDLIREREGRYVPLNEFEDTA